MPRRPRPPDPSPAEIEEAFAANVEWLARLGPVIPRHMIFVGWEVRDCAFREIEAVLRRWIEDGRMIETEAGELVLLAEPSENRLAQVADEGTAE